MLNSTHTSKKTFTDLEAQEQLPKANFQHVKNEKYRERERERDGERERITNMTTISLSYRAQHTDLH